MIGKRIAVGLTAVAVIGAFGPAFAQSGYQGNTKTDVNASAQQGASTQSSSTDTSMSAGAGATGSLTGNQSSADANSSPDKNPCAWTSQSSAKGSAASGATASSDDNDRFQGQNRGDAYSHKSPSSNQSGG